MAEEVAVDLQQNFDQYLKDDFDRSEFHVAKETILILEDMGKNSKQFSDLCCDITKDVYSQVLHS